MKPTLRLSALVTRLAGAVVLAASTLCHAQGTVATPLPSAESILKRYQDFLGGAAALAKVTTRSVYSRRVEFSSDPSDEDLVRHSKLPLLSIMRRDALDGTLLGWTNGCDETGGWSGYQRTGDKGAARAGAASTDGICEQEAYYYEYLPLDVARMKENVQRLEVKTATMIVPTEAGPWAGFAGGRGRDLVPAGPRRAYLVLSTPVRSADIYAWLYFDIETGALLRRAEAGHGPTPVPPGSNPRYTDFIQYRDIGDGTRAPFQFVSVGPSSEVRGVHMRIIDNEPLSDDVFTRPKDVLREDKGL